MFLLPSIFFSLLPSVCFFYDCSFPIKLVLHSSPLRVLHKQPTLFFSPIRKQTNSLAVGKKQKENPTLYLQVLWATRVWKSPWPGAGRFAESLPVRTGTSFFPPKLYPLPFTLYPLPTNFPLLLFLFLRFSPTRNIGFTLSSFIFDFCSRFVFSLVVYISDISPPCPLFFFSCVTKETHCRYWLGPLSLPISSLYPKGSVWFKQMSTHRGI